MNGGEAAECYLSQVRAFSVLASILALSAECIFSTSCAGTERLNGTSHSPTGSGIHYVGMFCRRHVEIIIMFLLQFI